MNLIDRFTQWLIPDKMVKDAENLRASRFTAISILAAAVLGFGYLIIDYLIGYWIGVYTILVFLLAELVLVWAFRKFGNVAWIGNTFATLILLIITISVFSTGGLYSPSVGWMFAAVITFFWYVNKLAGYFWSVVCFLTLFVLYFLTTGGQEFPINYQREYQPMFTLLSHVGLFIYLLSVFSLFEREHRDENELLNIRNRMIIEKNQELEEQKAVTEEKSKLLKEAYRRLEERKDQYYRKLIENSEEVFLISDEKGVTKFISANIEKVFGYTPSEVLHESGFKFMHPSDLERVSEDFQKVLSTDKDYIKSTYRFKHKNGSWYYVESSFQNMLHDEDIKGIVINSRNINEHIKNQQKVAEKERYYRSLIENSSDIISIIDVNGNYQYLSPSFEKQFGFFAMDLIGEKAFEFVHSEDKEEVIALFNKVKKIPGWQLMIEKPYRMPDKTGNWRYLESAVHNLVEDLIIKGVVINTRIVDDKVLSQRKLKEKEKYYRSLIENSMDLISVRDANAVITYCSPSTRHILGFEEEELIGTTGFHLIHPDDKLAAEKDWAYMMAHPNEVIRIVQRVQRKDGSWIFIEARAINLLHVEGVRGVVSNFSDITQRKEAEMIQKKYEHTLEKEVASKTLQLKEQNRELGQALNRLKSTQAQLVNAEKMASLGQLTAGIAHEINNPINFVSGNIYPLKTDFQDLKEVLGKYQAIADSDDKLAAIEEAEKLAEDVDISYLYEEMEALIEGIEEGANRTRNIVVGLRNFSRLDEDSAKPADIHSGLDATLVLLKNKTKNRIKIVRNYDDSIGEIECYPGKLNQVFMNLLSNAIEAIQDKGIITITTENQDEHILVKIKDSGLGMTNEVQERIFEPFFTTKDVGQGIGLGLSITYGIIEQHNGKIFVNSELGKGSEFVIVLHKKLDQ